MQGLFLFKIYIMNNIMPSSIFPTKTLDDIDKSILNLIQSNFPITTRPYKTIADNFGLSEQDVLTRLSNLKKQGIINRMF